MVVPHGETAGNAGSSDQLEVPPDALVERLQRRVAALERQLDARIARIDQLQARVEDQDRALLQIPQLEHEMAALRLRVEEYDRLLQTFTMRTLQRPREWYAAARRWRAAGGSGGDGFQGQGSQREGTERA